jgi:hypothetical protein
MQSVVFNGLRLGADYTCDSANEWPYDSVYNFLNNVV